MAKPEDYVAGIRHVHTKPVFLKEELTKGSKMEEKEEVNPFDEGWDHGTKLLSFIPGGDIRNAEKVAGALAGAFRSALLMISEKDALKAFEFAKYSALGQRPPKEES